MANGETRMVRRIRGRRWSMGSRRMAVSRWGGLRALSPLFMMAGGLLLAASLGYLIFAQSAAAQLSSLNQSAPDAPSVLPPVPFFSGTAFPPPTRVEVPRLEIDSGTSQLGTLVKDGELVWDTPKWSVGHHAGTANPGENGNMVLSGHISSPLSQEGNVFSRLPEVRLGDDVIVRSEFGVFYYRVTETKVVEPSQIEVMNPTTEPIVTLITCVPDWVYTHRLIVVAKPYRWEAAPAPAPLPSPAAG